MIELKSVSHCVYKIRYHMVLCVKYRKKLLYDDDKIEFIKVICSEIGKRIQSYLIKLALMEIMCMFLSVQLPNTLRRKLCGL